jgi:hypothetical protein
VSNSRDGKPSQSLTVGGWVDVCAVRVACASSAFDAHSFVIHFSIREYELYARVRVWWAVYARVRVWVGSPPCLLPTWLIPISSSIAP